MAASFTIPSVFTAIDKFSSPLKGMGDAVQGFVSRSERLLGRANTAFSKLMTPITGLNKMLMGLGYYVGLFTLVRIVKNAIDIFADFQQANADLAVVMGISVQKNRILATEARRIGLAYGEAATDVVKMQHALATLGFEQKDILRMGAPVITGAAALEGADPKRLAETVGALINTFDTLASKDTQHILDVMALSANRTALNFEKLATTLPIVSGPANAVNLSFEETVALLGVLANAGVHVATSATSLKNIFIDSAKKGHTYAQVIQNIADNSDKLVYANKQFGKRSVVSALALAQKMHDAKNGVIALTDEFKKAELGLTALIAADRLNTFRGAQKLLNAAWNEFVLSIEDGTGPFAQSLTQILKIAAAMLLLSSDSDQAREAISKMDRGIVEAAKKWLFWLKVIKWVAIAIITMKAILLVWEAALVAANVVTFIAAGAMKGWAAGVWLVNAAMAANPIGLMIILISLLIASVLLAVNYFDEWGSLMLSVFMPVVNLIILFWRNWQMIVDSFKKGGLWSGIKAIGAVLLDAVLLPLQQVAEILYNLTGANWAADAVKQIDALREAMGVDTNSGVTINKIKAINPKVTDQETKDSNSLNGNINVNLFDPGNVVKDIQSDSTFIMPRISNTNSFSY